VSHLQEVVLPDVQSDGDTCGEVEVNWQRQKGEESRQIFDWWDQVLKIGETWLESKL
jgi:hypothetical protein